MSEVAVNGPEYAIIETNRLEAYNYGMATRHFIEHFGAIEQIAISNREAVQEEYREYFDHGSTAEIVRIKACM